MARKGLLAPIIVFAVIALSAPDLGECTTPGGCVSPSPTKQPSDSAGTYEGEHDYDVSTPVPNSPQAKFLHGFYPLHKMRPIEHLPIGADFLGPPVSAECVIGAGGGYPENCWAGAPTRLLRAEGSVIGQKE